MTTPPSTAPTTAPAAALPTVSVVIPTRDRRRLLSETVATVLEQRRVDWELIIVDDGSTDDTLSYLRSLHDPRVRWTRHPESRGVSAARNAGFALARGEFVMFLDDDDLLRPDATARMVDALRAHPEALEATAACRLFHEDGDSVRVYRPDKHSYTRYILRELIFDCWAGSGQNLYRAAVIRDIGGFDPELPCNEVLKLRLEVARRGPACVLPFVSTEYRQHRDQATKRLNFQPKRQHVWAQFIESLPPSLRPLGRRIRRAAELTARAERARAAGQFATATRLQLGAIASAPSLLASPLLGRPLWWGLKKSLLRVRTP
jgi:glycosyltransferase involved in cell wall biosynthesis